MRRLLDVLLVCALAGYVLAGTALAPFHGDESTLIYMSRDFFAQFVQGDVARLRYSSPPASAQEQELRLLNGSLSKMLIGLSWALHGGGSEDINEQWDWGADWDYNQRTGHAPTHDLLLAARLPGALLLASGVIAMFGLGWALGGRPAAWGAALLFALHPALLLNGRRAMMESALIAFSLLMVLAAIWWARARRGQGWAALLFGAASGLALASKHTALFAVVPVFAAAGVIALARPGRARRLAQLALAAAAAVLIFYALNPVWWGDPLARPAEVLALRTRLLEGQTAAFGGYSGIPDALAGFLRQTFAGAPQYYEDPRWAGWIGGEIAAYEASGLAGVTPGIVGGAVLLVLAGIGLAALAWRRTGAAGVIVGAWALSAVGAALALTPVEWARYYLPAVLPTLALAAFGAASLWGAWRARRGRSG